MEAHAQPLVSVIVPIYKVERYLDACVRSIVAQTYRNLEILLVDDGSPDDCPRLCDAWAERDPRITVLHKPNGGLADARNHGIDHAHGDYVYCVDSDDWIDDDLIETTLGKALEHDADLVVFVYDWADEDGSATRTSHDFERFPAEGTRTGVEALELLWANAVQNFAWAILARREVYGEDIRFPVGEIMEDLGTTYRLFDRARRVHFLPRALYHYRIRPRSILSEQTPVISTTSVRFVTAIDAFARERHPRLDVAETNWSIRFLCATTLWAYQCRRRWAPGAYRAFLRSNRRLIAERIRRIGVRNTSRTNLAKSAAIFLRMLPALDYVAARINASTSR